MSENPATSVEQLEQQVAQQTALFNTLRSQHPAGSPELEDARKKLSELKKTLGQSKKDDAAKDGASGKKKERLLLKTAKVSARIV
jgi:histidyl-tRNA synthetase